MRCEKLPRLSGIAGFQEFGPRTTVSTAPAKVLTPGPLSDSLKCSVSRVLKRIGELLEKVLVTRSNSFFFVLQERNKK